MYGPRQVFVPKMPALGLLLEYPIFENYSRRVAAAAESAKLAPGDPDFRPGIDFEAHRAQLDAFKETHIYAKMRAIEDQFGMCVFVLLRQSSTFGVPSPSPGMILLQQKTDARDADSTGGFAL